MPSGHKSVFEALALLAPTHLELETPNLVQGCIVTRSFKILKFRGVKKLGGVKILIFPKILISIISGRIMPKYTNLGQKKFQCKKLGKNLEILHYDFDPAGDV